MIREEPRYRALFDHRFWSVGSVCRLALMAGRMIPWPGWRYRMVAGWHFRQYRPFPHGWTDGSWLGAMEVNAALVRAKTSGEGAIDISCADVTLMALGQEALPALNGDVKWPPPPENQLGLGDDGSVEQDQGRGRGPRG